MKRKTPVKHQVKSYTRKGKRVSSYTRGEGARNYSRLAKPNIKKPKGFTVKLRYSNTPHDIETVKVIATSYKRAIDEAFEEKMDKRHPIEIEVVDPSIGSIIKWAGERAVKYGKKAVVAGGQFAKAKLKESYSDWETKQLVDQAYSPNRGTRMLARAKLRQNRPDVYDLMDFSKS